MTDAREIEMFYLILCIDGLVVCSHLLSLVSRRLEIPMVTRDIRFGFVLQLFQDIGPWSPDAEAEIVLVLVLVLAGIGIVDTLLLIARLKQFHGSVGLSFQVARRESSPLTDALRRS